MRRLWQRYRCWSWNVRECSKTGVRRSASRFSVRRDATSERGCPSERGATRPGGVNSAICRFRGRSAHAHRIGNGLQFTAPVAHRAAHTDKGDQPLLSPGLEPARADAEQLAGPRFSEREFGTVDRIRSRIHAYARVSHRSDGGLPRRNPNQPTEPPPWSSHDHLMNLNCSAAQEVVIVARRRSTKPQLHAARVAGCWNRS